MLAENTIDIVKIGLEYILLAVFFMCVLKFILVRNEYAEALNLEYDMQVQTQERLEFGKYNTGLNQYSLDECLNADAVLEAVRNYREGEINLYVDYMKDGSELLVDARGAYYLPRPGGTAQPASLTVNELIGRLDLAGAKYHPFLVYDNQDMRGPYTNEGLEIKGIAFILYR